MTGKDASLILATDQNSGTGEVYIEWRNSSASYFQGMDISESTTSLFWNTAATVGATPKMELSSSGNLTITGTSDVQFSALGAAGSGGAQLIATAGAGGGGASVELTAVGATEDAIASFSTGGSDYSLGVDRDGGPRNWYIRCCCGGKLDDSGRKNNGTNNSRPSSDS